MRTFELGVATIAALEEPLERVLDDAAAAALDGVELSARPPHLAADASSKRSKDIARMIESRGLKLICYGSYYGRGPGEFREDEELLRRRCEQLEPPFVRVWAEATRPGETIESTSERLLRLAETLAPSQIVIERHAGSFADTATNIRTLLRGVDLERLALNYQPLDQQPLDDAAKAVADAQALLPFSRYMHIKNYRVGPDGTMALFGSLESGLLDYRELLTTVQHSGYSAPLTIEFVHRDPGTFAQRLKSSVDFVRSVLRKR